MRLGVLILFAMLLPTAFASDPPLVMRYQDGLLTVHLEHVPLDQVIERLEKETDIQFHGMLLDWREVSKEFDALPLPQALKRILGRQNFILRYDAAGNPESVELGGLLQPRQSAKTPNPAVPTNVFQLLATAPRVAVTPALRGVTRAATVSLSQLFLVSLQHADPALRTEATRALLKAVQENRQLRDALSKADPKSLVPLFRSLPPEQTDARLLDLSQASPDPFLRTFFLRARTQAQQDRAVRSQQSHG